MEIRIESGKAYIFTPYNAEFVKRIKNVSRAKWDGSQKCWVIPEASVPAARAIMEECYGYSDISGTELVTVKVTFNYDFYVYTDDAIFLGKTLSHARGRDSGATSGDDVSYLKGKPESGGSAKNWTSVVPAGSVVILSNVGKSLFDELKPSEDYTVELVESVTPTAELEAERERLMKRIAEIDALLGK